MACARDARCGFALTASAQRGVYELQCQMNHSCLPNVVVAGDAVLQVMAARDISAGEELFHSCAAPPQHARRAGS